jgi:protein-S-isoprenylcysteine O-methyltransferase Ste14
VTDRAGAERILALRLLGTPPINRFWFVTGKISLFVTLAYFVLAIIRVDLSWVVVPVLKMVGFILAGVGATMLVLAFVYLGKSVRMGLPKEQTELKTGGIYQFSRNPMYLSLFMLAIASCLVVINPTNITCAVLTIAIHHHIILAEERFLEGRFGSAFDEYRSKVRRYL